MTTQDSETVPFGVSHEQEAFKLLELPPEVLALLEAENPPTLQLTAARPSSPTAAAHAVLSTGGKAYQIRQKNTSSPIMVLRPAMAGVVSVAVIEDTLELVATESGPAKTNKWHEKFVKSRAAK